MPRNKRKDDVEGKGINRYLGRQNEEAENQSISESEEISLNSFKDSLTKFMKQHRSNGHMAEPYRFGNLSRIDRREIKWARNVYGLLAGGCAGS